MTHVAVIAICNPISDAPCELGMLARIAKDQLDLVARPSLGLEESGEFAPARISQMISQMISLNLACDLRQTLETQGYFAHLCHADRGTQWVTAKMRICGLVLTAA